MSSIRFYGYGFNNYYRTMRNNSTNNSQNSNTASNNNTALGNNTDSNTNSDALTNQMQTDTSGTTFRDRASHSVKVFLEKLRQGINDRLESLARQNNIFASDTEGYTAQVEHEYKYDDNGKVTYHKQSGPDSIIETEYENGIPVHAVWKMRRQDGTNSVTEYNYYPNGNTKNSHSVTKNSAGDVTNIQTNEYYEDGTLKSYYHYYDPGRTLDDGSRASSGMNEYDENGRKIRETNITYYPDGSVMRTEIIEFDENGNTTTKIYDADGNLITE